MQRTTTIATLLFTVAVSALTGCVTVNRPPTPGPSVGQVSAKASVPRPDGSARPRAVQAPAREALELVGDSGGRRGHHTPPATPPPGPRPTAKEDSAHRIGGPRPRTQPEPHHGSRPSRPAGIPDMSRTLPRSADVCALGKAYGGWRADSPQARICRQAYGH